MIIHTRYRDVPLAEVSDCLIPEQRSDEFWNEYRGKPVSIEVPSTDLYPGLVKCKTGPFFYAIGGGLVCPHIAEIGD